MPDGSNPCRRIKKYPERKRKRYLRGNELAQLGEALRESEHEGLETRSSINLIRHLLYTGCRLSEILTLKWDYVDLENGVLRLPDSKTGEKIVHIGGAAVRCLAGIEQIEDNPWVITGKLPRSHLVSPQRAWQRIRARAGPGDVRIHDLRHTCATTSFFKEISSTLRRNVPLLAHCYNVWFSIIAKLGQPRLIFSRDFA